MTGLDLSFTFLVGLIILFLLERVQNWRLKAKAYDAYQKRKDRVPNLKEIYQEMENNKFLFLLEKSLILIKKHILTRDFVFPLVLKRRYYSLMKVKMNG